MAKTEKSQYVAQVIRDYEKYFSSTEELRYKESDSLVEVMRKATQRSALGIFTAYEDNVIVLQDKLKSSVKFRLPENGSVMNGVTEGKTLPFIINNFLYEQHLPYPQITLEFDTNNITADNRKYRASVIYVEEIPREEGQRALLRANIVKKVKNGFDEHYSWSYLKYALEIDFAKVNSDTADYFDFVTVFKWDESDQTSPKETIQNTRHEIEVLLQFMLALSCRNVEVKQEFAPNPKENAKRAQKGHTLKYQYNTITINTDKGGKSDAGHGNGTGTGRTVSPHLRRGHIRRYENKNVWIESTVVKADKADDSLKAKKYVIK